MMLKIQQKLNLIGIILVVDWKLSKSSCLDAKLFLRAEKTFS